MTTNTFLKNLNLDAIINEAFDAAAATTREFIAKHGERDACGFAWVCVKPARGAFFNALKANDRARVHKNYEGGGVQVWNPSGNHTQAITAKEEGARAFVEVLRKYGITKENTGVSIWTGSRMD